MRIYVAGPMTGLPNLNFPAFNSEAERLRRAGHEVINPAEINPDPTASWKDCMRADLAQLVRCDAVQLLPGWQGSRGARLEHHVASELGLLVLYPGGVTPQTELEAIQYGALQASVQARNALALSETTGVQ